MKLIIAIVNSNDSQNVLGEITQAGFYATKLSTTGGFLRAGNLTLLMGVKDDKVDTLLDILRANCKKRQELAPLMPSMEGAMMTSVPVPITVGGATVFVIDVEQFHKM